MQREELIKTLLLDSAAIKTKIANSPEMVGKINSGAEILINSIKSDGTIYSCGNGGSSNDAMHFSEELVARYKRERRGFKAIHFMDAAVLTCWSNDYSFETAFARQAETFCGKNDVLVAISTSGNSGNIIKAVEAARAKGTKVIGLAGKDGGQLAKIADVAIVVPANETERIQESHINIIHIFCEIIETNIV